MLDALIAGLAESTPKIYDAVLAPLGGFLSRPLEVIRVPNEPATIVLALIGLGTIAAYVAAARYLRPERVGPRQSDRFSHQLQPTNQKTDRKEMPRRGAA